MDIKKTSIPFRQLDDDFFRELKQGKLSYILKFERKHRKSFMIEIRNNFLDLYFLGHSIEVKRTKNKIKYYISASNTFNPKELLPDKIKEIIRSDNSKWRIYFDDVSDYELFEKIIISIIAKIVEHKRGSISECVSEINHFIDNRDIGKNGILIIDRQVVYPGTRYRIDLLGLRRVDKNKFTFVVIELKNRNNAEIGQVFSQTKNYIDILYKKYEHFKITYEKVLEQKMKLGLLKRISCEINPFEKISEKDILGLVILDNFNIRSDLKNINKGGLLSRAISDWKKNKDYSLQLFLKTNVLDDTFFVNLEKTEELLKRYKEIN